MSVTHIAHTRVSYVVGMTACFDEASAGVEPRATHSGLIASRTADSDSSALIGPLQVRGLHLDGTRQLISS